jgi:hypothetical protein
VELVLRLHLDRELFARHGRRRGATAGQRNSLREALTCTLKVLGSATSRGYMILPHVPRGMLEVRPAERVQHKDNYLGLDTHLAYCEATLPASSSRPSGYPHHTRD